ncbi:MAG: hypothetical protein SF053_08935 [Bacteroidia bacterium]|nr:hypothetical protein [Bacteroidia bacterium]
MKNFETLQQVWGTASAPAPAPDAADKIIRQVRRTLRQQWIIGLVSLLLVVPVIVSIWIWIPFESVWTYAGMSLILCCILGASLYMVLMYRQVPAAADLPPADLLSAWEQHHTRMQQHRKWFSRIYMTFLSLGLAMYMTELLVPASWTFRLVAIGSTAGWILFVWTWLGPRMQQKSDVRYEALITALRQKKQTLEA